MFNGQSTESLESLSDELASNSGGNNTSTNNRDAVSRRVSFLPPTTELTVSLMRSPTSTSFSHIMNSFHRLSDKSHVVSLQLQQRHEYHRYKRCRALYDCEADNEDELSFEEGDIIIIIAEETEDDNWMEGILELEPDRRGLFPASFVHMLSD